MLKIHNLGFPRIGDQRQLKFALEKFWRGELTENELLATAADIRQHNWKVQANCGLDLIPVGDFSLYDQVLDSCCLLGVIPHRFQSPSSSTIDLHTYFRMARGRSVDGQSFRALEMTKWFDTNYHCMVPEVDPAQKFNLNPQSLLEQIEEITTLGLPAKPVIIGPLTWLWLAKTTSSFDKLSLLEDLTTTYAELLHILKGLNITWVQIDEPVLGMDLPDCWQDAFKTTYDRLQHNAPKLLLTSYFSGLQDNLPLACQLPVDGIHLDLIRDPQQWQEALKYLPAGKVLSVGLINGRNIWKNDLPQTYQTLLHIKNDHKGDLWLAPSCSLLHVPVDLDSENQLDEEVKSRLAFARQKLTELELLRLAVAEGITAVGKEFNDVTSCLHQHSSAIEHPEIRQRCTQLNEAMYQRSSPFSIRKPLQQQHLNLPLFPTTTIGSFPQTDKIRQTRKAFKQGDISAQQYKTEMEQNVRFCIDQQLALGLDVLVHGEAERNDMVEYFGEQLEGFAFTRYGWVQSYGSRCVKPPVIYGDIQRPQAMTTAWINYAQSLTDRPVKGMLTGPVTILNWSFVREDIPRSETATQLALALRDEVCDLEANGVAIIQIDEAALREGLPLRKHDQAGYLHWAIRAFRLTASGVADKTQIHTHMCYSEFNDIIESIADMDADVITIETSRSNMELLDAFVDFNYPNDIGPGVYDIHSPNIPETEAILALMKKAQIRINAPQLWVNPDCGLKTRNWNEVTDALNNMVTAAIMLRSAYRQNSN